MTPQPLSEGRLAYIRGQLRTTSWESGPATRTARESLAEVDRLRELGGQRARIKIDAAEARAVAAEREAASLRTRVKATDILVDALRVAEAREQTTVCDLREALGRIERQASEATTWPTTVKLEQIELAARMALSESGEAQTAAAPSSGTDRQGEDAGARDEAGVVRSEREWPHTPFITITPGVQGGSPCMGGTRLPALTLAGYANSQGVESAARDYDIPVPWVRLAIRFAARALEALPVVAPEDEDEIHEIVRLNAWLERERPESPDAAPHPVPLADDREDDAVGEEDAVEANRRAAEFSERVGRFVPLSIRYGTDAERVEWLLGEIPVSPAPALPHAGGQGVDAATTGGPRPNPYARYGLNLDGSRIGVNPTSEAH